MSRKTKTTATKEVAKPALVPKLRFPDFVDDPSCAQVRLIDTADRSVKWSFIGGPFGSNLKSSDYVPDGVRIIQLQNIGDGEFCGNYRIFTSYEKADELLANNIYPGEIIMSKMGDPVGRACLIPETHDRYVMCSDGIRLVVNERANDKYFIYSLINSPLFRTVVEKTATGSTLFPREGETQPRLRFPEFQNKGEWVEQPFSNLCDIKHGYPFESEFFSNEGEYVLLTPGCFYEEGGYRDRGEKQRYYNGEIPRDYVLAEGDMLVAMTEQAAGLLGSPLIVPESDRFLHNQRLGLVARKPGVAWANEFFFHVFNSQRVRKAIHDTASGAKVRHTSPTKIGDVVVSVPTTLPEQQRIAACLSSLDALITAETQKHEALKTHKKGLMQQLFPSPEEVKA